MELNDIYKSIDERKDRMIQQVIDWCDINSGTYNVEGLDHMATTLKAAWSPLSDEVAELTLSPQEDLDKSANRFTNPIGKALVFSKRKNAKFRVLLSGHYDTVYAKESSFQKVSWIDRNTINGPGVADMKGGLVIMLAAIRAIEASPYAEKIGWDVVLNPDEEVGSMGSAPLLIDQAKKCTVGLVFEPSFADGTMVSHRKGSSNFSIVARGLPAHAGRDFFEGKNAVAAIADLMGEVHKWNWINDKPAPLVINCARIDGGGPANVVPELAIGRFNVRFLTNDAYVDFRKKIETSMARIHKVHGVKLEFFQQNFRAPKPFDENTEKLFNQLTTCAKDLGVDIKLKESGGVCDGNILSQAGLPNIDTLGGRGGKIHTNEEFLLVDSLTERAKLTACFLITLLNQHSERG